MKLVLVCDESMFIRHMLVSMLSNLGLRAVLASNGAEGLAMARSFRPDLVIAEVDMPEMGGIELLQIAREDLSLAPTPWVLMGSPGRREKAIAAGCAGFLPKPIKPKALEQVVDSALNGRPNTMLASSAFHAAKGEMPLVRAGLHPQL